MITLDDIRQRPTLSVAETAEVLGISVRHAYELAQRGDIPTLPLGSRRVVPTARLMRMLEGEPTEQQREAG